MHIGKSQGFISQLFQSIPLLQASVSLQPNGIKEIHGIQPDAAEVWNSRTDHIIHIINTELTIFTLREAQPPLQAATWGFQATHGDTLAVSPSPSTP